MLYNPIIMTAAQVVNMLSVLAAQSCLTLCDPVDYSPQAPHFMEFWNSPGKNTGVGCHSLLQGIFPTQGLNPGLPALQADSLPSEPPGKR